jgi:plasmid stabilization system protein ParE
LEPFQLTEEAILDIDAIWLYLLGRENLETADRIVTNLFKGFYKLADNPRIGHRRADLTSRRVLFYKVFSYLVIFDPDSRPLQILGVLHGKRNVSRILSQRKI